MPVQAQTWTTDREGTQEKQWDMVGPGESDARQEFCIMLCGPVCRVSIQHVQTAMQFYAN